MKYSTQHIKWFNEIKASCQGLINDIDEEMEQHKKPNTSCDPELLTINVFSAMQRIQYIMQAVQFETQKLVKGDMDTNVIPGAFGPSPGR